MAKKRRIIAQCLDPKKKRFIKESLPFLLKKKNEKFLIMRSSISNSVPLNYHIVPTHIISINLISLKDISFKAKYIRVVRLLKSNLFVVRKSTHIGQSIPKMLMKNTLFLSQVIKYRKIKDYDL